MNKIGSILEEVLEKINPSEKELEEINSSIEKFLKVFEQRLKTNKIKAEVFLGGSFAKGTVMKKDCYDLDVYVRFEEELSDKEMSELVKKSLKGSKKVSIVHGSRDYFRIKLKDDLFIEVVPVKKISKPDKAENITDLSYSHVKYIKKKVKNKKVLDEIKIAKAFCYANKCYGAESYINGFSGYALELLVAHYKSFEKFLKEMTKAIKTNKGPKNLWSKEYEGKWEELKKKIIIDIEKDYKKKENILMDLNSSKLGSPVILIDPTFKQRNALAALSEETFSRFKQAAEKFLKNPSIKSFELEKTDLEKVKSQALKAKREFVLIEAQTSKAEGDVAGTKLLKFYNHFCGETEKIFEVKKKGFNYNGKKAARYYFVVKPKKEILFAGPFVKDKDNLKAFERVHKNYTIKKGRVYAKEKIDFGIKEFIKKWKSDNKVKIDEMYITSLEVV
jgi:tRNA nucleotidyltransferase (CCA-adding enzyme)